MKTNHSQHKPEEQTERRGDVKAVICRTKTDNGISADIKKLEAQKKQ